jgi:galactose mutarotase-like enzyme
VTATGDLWRGETAVHLVTDEMAVTVLPRRGAKIASILYVPAGREWLEPPGGELGKPAGFGSVFTDGDMCGWDEMVPTIIRCGYPADPHLGTMLADHGEVWAVEWTVDSDDEALVCTVAGRALPYRFSRSMRAAGSRLSLSYELAVTGSAPLWLLWAAHPQFAVHETGTRMVLPPDVDQLVDVTAETPTSLEWPSKSLETSEGLASGEGRKLYIAPDTRVGSAALVDGDGTWLQMAWDPAVVPYLGIWLDNRAYSRRPVIALEPTTGYYDNLALAYAMNRAPLIEPGRPLRWTVEVTLGTGGLE